MLNIELNLKDQKVNTQVTRVTNIADLRENLAIQLRIPANQLRLEVRPDDGKKIVMNDSQTLDDFRMYLEGNKLTLTGRDLGTQIPYSSLFYIEYAFPPISVLLFYLLNLKNASGYNTLLTFCVFLHFAKRLLETKFVHIFSTPSVPFFVLLRNCGHYWLLIGILLPIEVFFLRQPTLSCCPTFLFLLFLACEAGNFYCHLMLRRLREIQKPDGTVEITTKRAIPTGPLFDQIISPNYTFEIFAWVFFTILFKSWVALVFTALSAVVMTQWAQEKQRKMVNLSLETNEKNMIRSRAAILPYVV